MKTLFSFALLASLTLTSTLRDSQACSSGHYSLGGKHYTVKSFDWDYSHALAFVNPRGMKKMALIPGMTAGTASWISKYGSVSFNQLAPEFPYSGMNENGLVVEILWEDQARNDQTDPARPRINESQWVQYLLDQAGDTREAIELAKAVSWTSVVAKVHYFVCDADGDCAVFDFTGGQPLIYSGSDLPIAAITNSPYAESLSALRQYRPWGGNVDVDPSSDESIERMARLAMKIAQPVSNERPDWMFGLDALDAVVNARTVWNIVYEQTEKKAQFLRRGFTGESFEFSAIDFTCRSGDRVGMVVNEEPNFGPISQERIDRFVGRNAFIPENYRRLLSAWHQGFACE